MTDSVQVLPTGFRVLDQSGDPVSGAKIKFWEGGTSTPLGVFSDSSLSTSLGSVVSTRSDGLPVSGGDTTINIYTGVGAYDIEITDADDVVIVARKINQRGALDTSSFLTSASTSTLSIPVVTKSTDAALDATYRGKRVNGNTTSGNVSLTLDEAATLGDGWNVEIGKTAAANVLMLLTTGAEDIYFNGQSHPSLALSGLGESMSIRCDGTAFYVQGYSPPLRNATGVIVIADRITSAPSSPTPGSRYIVTAGFSTYATHDIIEADAAGGFLAYTPATDCGWVAYVQDEDKYYAFRTSAWTQLGGSNLQIFTASGTYTPTPGMTSCLALVTGAGGGGGGADSDGSSNGAGGGGGAGGTAIGLLTSLQIGSSQTVTIGDGGAAGADTGGTGGTGGSTTLGALLTGSGGAGGAGIAGTGAQHVADGGAGGAASDGLLNIPGGGGQPGVAHGGGTDITTLVGGKGGNSFWGGGARSPTVVFAGTVTAGIAATVYGGGGSGGANKDTAAGTVGGAGKAGVIMIVEFF